MLILFELLTGQGLDINWLLTPDLGLPSPDITIFLSLPTSEASSREDFGAERYETQSMQKKVREMFGLVKGKVEVDADGGNGKWEDVDASGSREEVESRIWGAVELVLEREKKEVGRLWVSSST